MIFSSRCFLQKTNKQILLYYYETSGWLVFLRFFWRKLKTPKGHFEINWPLLNETCSCSRLYGNQSNSCQNAPLCNVNQFFCYWVQSLVNALKDKRWVMDLTSVHLFMLVLVVKFLFKLQKMHLVNLRKTRKNLICLVPFLL